jgi:tRNA uridine 5-carbamoylmethylation protein Kti12
MPLVLLVGHPASGKTRRATQLAEHLRGNPLPTQRQQQANDSQLIDDHLQDSSAPSPVSAPSSPDAAVVFNPVPASSPSPPVGSSPVPEVVLINLESLQLSRDAVYSSAASEKAARSALRTAVERLLTSSRCLILDELNGIKGFRYELWCRAREMGTTYCLLHVDTPPDTCRLWNAARPEHSRYPEAVSAKDDLSLARFGRLRRVCADAAMACCCYCCCCSVTDLLQRLETPNGSKRWDAPLFTVTPEQETPLQDISQVSAALQLSTLLTRTPLAHHLTPASSSSVLSQWLLHGKRQTPGLATLPTGVEDASYLQRVERVLSSVTQELVRLQQSGLGSVGDELQVKGSRLRLQLVRSVHYPELKRVQAQFSRMARQSSSSLQSDDDIATSYIAHVQNALNY